MTLTAPDTFKAVTWNVYHGTETKELEPIAANLQRKGVSLFLMQEAGGQDITKMLRGLGLQTFLHPRQYRVAWDPESWTELGSEGVELSDQPYWAKGGGNVQKSEAARTILGDQLGRTLDVVSYHTPAHIQVRDFPERRYIATLESLATLAEMAEESHATAFLGGGDLNWDPDEGIQREAMTAAIKLGGLRLIQAPDATHGKRREIDHFHLVRGGKLRQVKGQGWVQDGGGDHRVHGQAFRWAA